jgi:hypothetical protein
MNAFSAALLGRHGITSSHDRPASFESVFENWAQTLARTGASARDIGSDSSIVVAAQDYFSLCELTQRLTSTPHAAIPKLSAQMSAFGAAIGSSLISAIGSISAFYDGTRLTVQEREIATMGYLLSDKPQHRATSFAASDLDNQNFRDIVGCMLRAFQVAGILTEAHVGNFHTTVVNLGYELRERYEPWHDRTWQNGVYVGRGAKPLTL